MIHSELPPKGFRGIGNHSDTQLDSFADGKGQIFITVTEICNRKYIPRFGFICTTEILERYLELSGNVEGFISKNWFQV